MQAPIRPFNRVLRLLGIFSLICSLSSPLATAALLSQDDAVLGQNTVTLDTQTNLQWLDLDLSANLSWNAAANTYAAFGFRHATLNEVERFFINAGIPDIDTGTSQANYAPAQALQNLITCVPGFNTTTSSFTCGSFGFTAISNGFSELSWVNRNDTRLEATVIVNSNNIIGPDPVVFDTFASPNRSHWLVRSVTVPAPSSLLLVVAAAHGWRWQRRAFKA